MSSTLTKSCRYRRPVGLELPIRPWVGLCSAADPIGQLQVFGHRGPRSRRAQETARARSAARQEPPPHLPAEAGNVLRSEVQVRVRPA